MTDTLSLDRFRELADAYGGVIARWPEEQRDAAMRLAATPAAIAILAQAAALDETLDMWRMPLPAAHLADRLVASAPVARRIAAGRNLGMRARLWWSGIGMAAALTGAVAGAAAVAIAAPIEAPSDARSDSATPFGDIAAQEG